MNSFITRACAVLCCDGNKNAYTAHRRPLRQHVVTGSHRRCLRSRLMLHPGSSCSSWQTPCNSNLICLRMQLRSSNRCGHLSWTSSQTPLQPPKDNWKAQQGAVPVTCNHDCQACHQCVCWSHQLPIICMTASTPVCAEHLTVTHQGPLAGQCMPQNSAIPCCPAGAPNVAVLTHAAGVCFRLWPCQSANH